MIPMAMHTCLGETLADCTLTTYHLVKSCFIFERWQQQITIHAPMATAASMRTTPPV